MRGVIVSVVLLLCCGSPVAAKPPKSPSFTRGQFEFFEKRVRPLLAANCFSCHGSGKQKSGLRLDSRARLLKGGETGRAVIAGMPEKSLLIQAVRHSGDIRMPPKKKLSSAQIADLVKWVRLGLPWPKDSSSAKDDQRKNAQSHWAFRPMRQPPVPSVRTNRWARTPIDRFILARLEAKGLRPSPPASQRTLIRRATYDLIGLPPTPKEVEQFLADSSPDAFNRLIDRLLSSPQYGERWGRHWLDVARYADNKGYVFFEDKLFPWAYTYRDYVIRAFNEDLPYNRFVLEQLAADQLQLGNDQRPLTAMGFLTLGGRFMNNVHDILDDRIDVVTRGLMGLTVTCARCHDHKYDPIPQADYYSLYGVFRSSVEPTVPPTFQTLADTEEQRKFTTEMKKRLTKLEGFIERIREQITIDSRKRVVGYLLATHAKRNQPSTENFMLLTDKGGLNPYMIHRWEGYLQRSRKSLHPVWIPWHRFAALSDKEFSAQAPAVYAELFAAGKPQIALNPLVRKAFAQRPPQSMRDVAAVYGDLLQSIRKKWRASTRNGPSKKDADAGKTKVRRRLTDDAEEELRLVLFGTGSPPVLPRVIGWGFLTLIPDRPTQAEFKKLLKQVETWSRTAANAPPRAMVLVDADVPFDPVIFQRGNPYRPGKAVARQFLRVFSDAKRRPFRIGSGRLELAKAIVDPKNPLTARVIVNRIWRHHFGKGLVTTPSDFGTRSDPPSHPALLDALAIRFIRSGWSIKQLHREIMQSSVYQQSAGSVQGSGSRLQGQKQKPSTLNSPSSTSLDPENRLLWKFNRRRLDFESTRDALLAVTGALKPTLGGKPVRNLLSGFSPRRTVYGFVNRMDLPNLMRSFDFPEPSATSPKRDSTTVAPQALYLMNHQFIAECAKRVARRAQLAANGDAQKKVNYLYQLLFSRKPTNEEQKMAAEFHGKTKDRWPEYVHALLMTNEFVFVD
ncbi:MAG: PSD1 domain-containing protein [Planctomycetes bacterium]|nr:PSD1 domain-containing protein [Planctomycetota bacterium]